METNHTGGPYSTAYPAGQVLMLDPDVAHDVEALAESAFLLTIAWPR
jgi:hypothetical protein